MRVYVFMFMCLCVYPSGTGTVRPSVGDSLTNDTSSPDVTRGRLEASIVVVGRCSFRVRVTDNYNYNCLPVCLPVCLYLYDHHTPPR